MAKRQNPPTPIMTPETERFLAFEGLTQWTQAVVVQSARMSSAQKRLSALGIISTSMERRQVIHAFHTECHFFAIAANKLIEFRGWVSIFGLCSSLNFSEIDGFSAQDIKDLRNMREHVIDYFSGGGHTPMRWNVQTPEYKADASAAPHSRCRPERPILNG